MISHETVKEFQSVLKEEFNLLLSHEETEEILTNTVSYFDLLSKINHRNQQPETQE